MKCTCLGWELKVDNNFATCALSEGVYITENPALLPVCDKEKAWVPSTNGQFQFEVESHLNNLLEEQYGEVMYYKI